MREHNAREIARLRKKTELPSNAEIVQAVKAYRDRREELLEVEIAEYEASLRSPAGTLSRTEQAELAGRMASLATSLTLEYGEKADVEAFIKEVESRGPDLSTG